MEGASYPRIGRWAVLRRLGQGGMGIVYYGVHPRLGSAVAIKVLPRDLQERQPGLVARFVQEAKLAANLRSEHLVHVVDVDEDEATGAHFLVMEYVHGISGGRWLERYTASPPGGAPERSALEAVTAATRGLARAHEASVFHRDVKPDNLLIPYGDDGEPAPSRTKLADLGLARPADSGQNLTDNVIAMGTPGYAAPEQLHDVREAQKPADVFAMGATLYAFLAGSAPFARNSPMQRVLATFRGDYVPLERARPDVSRRTVELVRRCLRTRPEERLPDAAALLEHLDAARQALGAGGSAAPPPPGPDGQATTPVESTRTATFASPRLALSGGPPGARVTVQREDGGASLTLALGPEGSAVTDVPGPGAYRVVVSEPSHHEFVARVDLQEASSSEIRVAARPHDALLDVETTPPGADLLVDGVPAGRTPVSGRGIPPGRHTLTFRLDGHVDAARTIESRPGERVRVERVELQRLGTLDLDGLDAGVSVRRDGLVLSNGARIVPGRFAFLLVRDGYEPQTLEVDVAPGAVLRPEPGPWRRHALTVVHDLPVWAEATPAEREAAARAVERAVTGFAFARLEDAPGSAAAQVAVFAHAATGLEFALVPGGDARLGSPPDEPHRRSDERLHVRRVAPFLCARTPVTGAAWRRATGSEPPGGGPDDVPVTRVTWDEARAFCARSGLALPAESGWEWAARGGTTSPWSCGGEDALAAHAWFAANAGGAARPAGALAPNGFLLHDVHGNVGEWCEDAYGEYPCDEPGGAAATDAATDPATSGATADATSPRYRVFRGGGFADGPAHLRCAARSAAPQDHRSWYVGLRPVRDVAFGVLDATGLPADATVLLDGRELERRAPLAPGEYALVVQRPGCEPFPVRVVVAAGDAARLEVPSWERTRSTLPPAALLDLDRWLRAPDEERLAAAEHVARAQPGFALRGLETFSDGDRSTRVAVFLHGATGMEFVLVPGGVPGGRGADPSSQTALGRVPSEVRPGGAVPPFLVARTQVSQEVWTAVMGANPSHFKGARLPVEMVTWHEAAEFCSRAGLELPDEARWEFACRAGSASRWSFGDDESGLDGHAWYAANSGRSTHPVAEKLPNAFGLHDVHGNVWEWCADVFGGALPDESDPWQQGTVRRAVRGGAFSTAPAFLRSSARDGFDVDERMGTVGLRPFAPALPVRDPSRVGAAGGGT